jgi:hypothetical protein
MFYELLITKSKKQLPLCIDKVGQFRYAFQSAVSSQQSAVSSQQSAVSSQQSAAISFIINKG